MIQKTKTAITCLITFITLVTISIGCILIGNIIIEYASFNKNIQFLLLKKEYLDIKVWYLAFYVHVFSAFISLFVGFVQFLYPSYIHNKKLHRTVGKIYIWNILSINVPSGMVLAIYANGGIFAKTAFILLDILWFLTTYLAYKSARNSITHHVNYIIRSYSLTLSAISLRVWHIILTTITSEMNYNFLYTLEAWLGFVPNILIAELIIWKLSSKVWTKLNHTPINNDST